MGARNFLPFTDQDFLTFGGAFRFSDGNPPEVSREGQVDIVLDSEGIRIYWPEQKKWAYLIFHSGCKGRHDARESAKFLPDDLDQEKLVAIGFRFLFGNKQEKN